MTGGESSDLEKIMADGVGIIRRATLSDYTVNRKRSSLDLLSLAYGPLEQFQVEYNYSTAHPSKMLVCFAIYFYYSLLPQNLVGFNCLFL